MSVFVQVCHRAWTCDVLLQTVPSCQIWRVEMYHVSTTQSSRSVSRFWRGDTENYFQRNGQRDGGGKSDPAVCLSSFLSRSSHLHLRAACLTGCPHLLSLCPHLLSLCLARLQVPAWLSRCRNAVAVCISCVRLLLSMLTSVTSAQEEEEITEEEEALFF